MRLNSKQMPVLLHGDGWLIHNRKDKKGFKIREMKWSHTFNNPSIQIRANTKFYARNRLRESTMCALHCKYQTDVLQSQNYYTLFNPDNLKGEHLKKKK